MSISRVKKVPVCFAVAFVFLIVTNYLYKPETVVFQGVPSIRYIPQQTRNVATEDFLSSSILKSNCRNIYQNITNGRWRERAYDGVAKDRERLNELHRYFRQEHEGFRADPYRSDGKCGFKVPCCGFFPITMKTDASAWCDPDSATACCSDKYNGKCVSSDLCTGDSKINLAKHVHGEISDWIPEDPRCKMVLHDQGSACSLLKNANVKSIVFVGNSLVRNIHSAMLDLLTNNFRNGSVKAKNVDIKTRERCVNQIRVMDTHCLAYTLATSSDDLPSPGICNGLVKTRISLESFWRASYAVDLLQYVLSRLDEGGTYLFIGIGLHDHSDSKVITQQYLKPTLDALKGHTWPKVRWVTTVKSGIFKPANYVSWHGDDERIAQFDREVAQFCAGYGVPTVNLTKVTTGVWSQDGQHYGQGVNTVKAQIILNLIAEEYK
ncbi:uncharacterized protein LOC494393 [Ciona intestinalis]